MSSLEKGGKIQLTSIKLVCKCQNNSNDPSFQSHCVIVARKEIKHVNLQFEKTSMPYDYIEKNPFYFRLYFCVGISFIFLINMYDLCQEHYIP